MYQKYMLIEIHIRYYVYGLLQKEWFNGHLLLPGQLQHMTAANNKQEHFDYSQSH